VFGARRAMLSHIVFRCSLQRRTPTSQVVGVVFRHRSVLAAPAQLEASTRSASPNLEERATATTPAQSSCLKREGSPSYGPHSPGPAALEGARKRKSNEIVSLSTESAADATSRAGARLQSPPAGPEKRRRAGQAPVSSVPPALPALPPAPRPTPILPASTPSADLHIHTSATSAHYRATARPSFSTRGRKRAERFAATTRPRVRRWSDGIKLD
jgi:hypothetical protein